MWETKLPVQIMCNMVFTANEMQQSEISAHPFTKPSA